jgi:hypothetical protein
LVWPTLTNPLSVLAGGIRPLSEVQPTPAS